MGAVLSAKDMDMKKIAAASFFALALVACIALYSGKTESIKFYGESLSSLSSPSVSAPKTASSGFGSLSKMFGTDSAWDEDDVDEEPVPDQSALHGLSAILKAEKKPQSDFHDDSSSLFSSSLSHPLHKTAAPKKPLQKKAAPKKVSWQSLFTSTKQKTSSGA